MKFSGCQGVFSSIKRERAVFEVFFCCRILSDTRIGEGLHSLDSV